MSLLWTVAVVILVLGMLAISHALAWLWGYMKGQHVAAIDAQIEKIKAMGKQ